MRRAVTLLALILAAGTLMSCDTYNRNTFKLTIEVEVDGERKIASSVYEREINWNLGGVADRIRGTMPHMSLGRHGDIVVRMRGGRKFRRQQERNQTRRTAVRIDGIYMVLPALRSGAKAAR